MFICGVGFLSSKSRGIGTKPSGVTFLSIGAVSLPTFRSVQGPRAATVNMPALISAGCGSSKICVPFLRSVTPLLLVCLIQLYTTVQSYFHPPCEASAPIVPFTLDSAFGSPFSYLLSCAAASRANFPLTPLPPSAASLSPSPAGAFFRPLHRLVPFLASPEVVESSPPTAATAALFCFGLCTNVVHVAVSASSARQNATEVNWNSRPSSSLSSLHQFPVQKKPRLTFRKGVSEILAVGNRASSPDSFLVPPSNLSSFHSLTVPFSISFVPCIALLSLLSSFLSSPVSCTPTSPDFLSSPTEWSIVRNFFSQVSLPSFATFLTFFSLLPPLARPLLSAALGCRPFFPKTFPFLYTVTLLGAAATSRLHFAITFPLPSSLVFPSTAEPRVPYRLTKQTLCNDFVFTPRLHLSQPLPGVAFASFAPGVSPLLHHRLCPVRLTHALPATAAAKPSASADRAASAVLQLLSSIVGAVSSVLPAPLYVAAHPQRRRAHLPPVPHDEAGRQDSFFSREGANDDVATEGGGGLLGRVLGPSMTADEAASASEGRTVLRTAPTIRPRRRVPGRRSSPDWQQLFPDLRLVDIALPATLHSALTDVNSVKYFELAVAQKVPVSRQLLDGIRMFDVRAWRDAQDGHWYSEVPWRLEDDFRLLREYAPTAEEASPSNFVSSMLRNLPPPLRPGGGKDRGRRGQQHGSDKRRGGAAANGGGAGGRKVPAKVSSLVDLHSWTSLEEGLFKPVQEFLRMHISEVAVVVISSFNGNRKTAMNAVPRGASLASSLQRFAARQQQRQQEGTAAGISSARLEGHPFFEEFIYRAPPDNSASGEADGNTKQQQQSRSVGGVSGRAGVVKDYPSESIPVLSSEAAHNSPAYLDSLGTSPAAYEVQDPLDTTSSFYMSSAVRKPLTYADVASFMALVDKYWGQLLPRHSHVFFGPADDTAYSPPPAAQAAQASPAAASSGAGSSIGAAAAAAASQAQPVSAAEAAASSLATSAPSAAALQESPLPSVPRLLMAAAGSPAVAAVEEQLPAAPAPAALPEPGVRALVVEATARSFAARESEAMEKSSGRAQSDASKQPAANMVTPVTRSVGGAPARGVATPDLRAAASRPPVPATAATSAGPAVDTYFAGATPGATAAVFSSGFDTSPNLYSAADRRQLPTGRPPASAAYREPEATSASTLPEVGTGASPNARGATAEYSHSGAAASIANQIDSYPMYESLHRPETFAEWLRAQGDLLLAKATLKDLIDAKIRLLLFVDDPLIAWYITVFSREHVVVFVAADHIYDVLYKSEALFGPCALPNRASGAPNSMLLSVTREAAWAGCRERCESTPPVAPRPEEGRLVNKMRPTRGRAAAARDASANSRSCTYWTFEPPVSLGSLPPVINNGDELYPPVSPADLGLLPFTPVAGSNVNANTGSKVVGHQQDAGKGGNAAATVASTAPFEMKGECRTYTGALTLADTVPLHGSIIQPRSCSLRTLYELPTQWASAAVFADLTDAVCPIFEVPGGTPGAGDPSIDQSGRPVADGLADATAFGARDARHQKEPRSFQFLPELCMLDATPRSLRDALQAQEEDDGLQPGEDTLHTNLKRWRGIGLERKLLRVYFSPPSPVPFVDGTRGGKREVGPVDAVSLMNELTATWALWQLERQQLVGSLTVVELIDPMGVVKNDGYAYGDSSYRAEEASQVAPGESSTGRGSMSMGMGGGGAGRSSLNAFYGGTGPHLFAGRERPRSTRPVNALMVMRYDQTKSLIKNFSHLNYFEIVMNLNPQPRETRSVIFQGSDGADLSADRYVKVTAILNSFGLEDELGEISGHLNADGLDGDDTTEEEKRDQAFMMWLAICAAIVCFIVAIVGSTVRSAVSKRVPRGGWTAAVTPRRASVASEPSPSAHHLENLS